MFKRFFDRQPSAWLRLSLKLNSSILNEMSLMQNHAAPPPLMTPVDEIDFVGAWLGRN